MTDDPRTEGCASCGEGDPKNECPKSQRPCGHHCNHIWEVDACDWCGYEAQGDEDPLPTEAGDVEAISLELDDEFGDIPVLIRDITRAVLASGWLAQHTAAAGARAWDEGWRGKDGRRVLADNPYRRAARMGGE